MEKSIFLITIDATKYGYSDKEDNINKILSIFKNEETKDIANYNDFEKEINSVIGNRGYFIFKWSKDIFDKLLNIDNSNLKNKDKNHFTSMLEYCGMIPEEQIVIVILDGNIDEDLANKIEEIITIYSYTSIECQSFARKFLKNDFYRCFCTFLNKTYKVPKKENRTCKYCGKDKENTSFRNDSHIIPRSLGNSKYIDAEECDNCNQKFSLEIENDSTNFFNLLLKKDSYISNINMQNLYRLLVKITLGFIPYNNIHSFCNTIDWLNNTSKSPKLPKIILSKNYNGDFCHPEMFICTRKVNNYNIPYMYSEFYINNFLFTYMVPFCKFDNIDFTDTANFNNFIKNTNIMKYYNNRNNLEYIELDCNENNKSVDSICQLLNKL